MVAEHADALERPVELGLGGNGESHAKTERKRRRIPLYDQAALNAAVLSERERCATIALNTASHCEDHENHYGASAAKDVADRIRDA